MCRQSATVCLTKSPTAAQRAEGGIVGRLAALPDPRDRRGRRHSLVSVLLTPACAVLAGARSYLAIGQWAKNAPQDTLARLGVRAVGAFGVRRAPSTGTIRRVLAAVCPGGLADLLGCDPADTSSLAVDGKSARGSRTESVKAAHLLSAVTADGRIVSQLRVPDKTTEVTALAPLLAPFDLRGVVVTADALHTTAAHARFLVDEKQAHYLLVVKANQPALFATLRALPWQQATARFYERGSGHGRQETRSVRAPTVTDLGLGFPHLVQAARIHRWCRDIKTGKVSRQTIYAITSMTTRDASPQRIGQLARRSGFSRPCHVRDVTFAEDASKIRTGHGPENMATLRNLAINTLRDAGHRSIAAGLREVSYAAFTRPLELFGLA
ncbi:MULTISPECIES: ISAs1 family transposase [unclassified Streptomyces]|uniref:ISAs1 family transposase n=1 Tax=unclassified Streptomyces TaxID=2593676 RepID=UPI002E1DFC9D|nr:ISAs1 family transposase [Streptomyces sp. NBC_01023]